jgi:signal peptidase I
MGTRTGFLDGRDVSGARPQSKGVVREYIELILVCVIFLVFVRSYVIQPSEIPSGSMEDSILVGDYILVNRFSYAPVSYEWERRLLPRGDVQRGDVVVFKHPPSPERDFIKRVIGLPGETVELRDGQVFVDGVEIAEPYLNELYRSRGSFGPVKVAPDHFFVMGDHRNHSRDSREWGSVSRDLLKGRAFVILVSVGVPADADGPQERVTLGSVVSKLFNLVFYGRWDRALRPIE